MYITDAHDDGHARTWSLADLEPKARKVGITPGSPLWPLMTASAGNQEGLHGEEGHPEHAHIIEGLKLGAQLGRGVSGFLYIDRNGRCYGPFPRGTSL